MFESEELEEALGIKHVDPNYAETVRTKMQSLTDNKLVELGKKYIPDIVGRGALTFLIKEILGRVCDKQGPT